MAVTLPITVSWLFVTLNFHPSSFFLFHSFLLFMLFSTALGFPGGSEVKASARNEGDLGSIPRLGRRRRKWQPTPISLPGESHGQRSLGGYISPRGHKKSDTTERLHFHFHFLYCIGSAISSSLFLSEANTRRRSEWKQDSGSIREEW